MTFKLSMSLDARLTHSAALQVIGKAFSTVLGLIAVILMMRFLSLEQFGWYATASGFLQFVGIASDFGFIIVTANMMSEPEHDKTKLLNTIFSWRIITALIIQIPAPLIYFAFSHHGPTNAAIGVLAIAYFTTAINQVFIGYFQSQHKNYLQIVGEILNRIGMIVGMYFVVFNRSGFIPVVLVVSLSSLIYTLFLWSRCPQIRFGMDKKVSHDLFHRMWPTALAIIFNAFYLQGDRVILPWYTNAEQVGLYGSAYRVIDIVTQTVAMIMGIMAPLLTYHWSRKLFEKFKGYYQLSFDLTALFLFPAIAGIMALATPIMHFIDAKYDAAGPILMALIWSVAGIWLGMTFGYIILTLKKQRQALLVYFSDAIISVIAYFIFIPRFGVWGAVGVSVFSELYAGLFLFALCSYYTRIIPHATTFLKILLASFLMGLGVYYLRNHLLFAILGGIGIYAGLVILFRIISPTALKQLFSKKTQQIID